MAQRADRHRLDAQVASRTGRTANAVWVLPDQGLDAQPAQRGRAPGRGNGPFAYLRLLRDREAVDALTPTLDHIVIDRGAQVAGDARAIQALRQRVPVVEFVNNHYTGYAPQTASHLVALTDVAT